MKEKLIYASTLFSEQKNILILGKNPGKTRALINQMIRKIVEHAPAVDAVEVVRCKACKKWNANTGACDEFTTQRYPAGGRIIFLTCENDFCSYGERENNDHK